MDHALSRYSVKMPMIEVLANDRLGRKGELLSNIRMRVYAGEAERICSLCFGVCVCY